MGPEPDRGRNSWIWVLAVLAAGILVGAPFTWWLWRNRLPDTGLRFTFSIEPSPSLRRSTADVQRELGDVLRRRFESLGRGEVRIQVDGEVVVVTISGVHPALAPDYRRLLSRRGLLELCSVAPQAVQEKFNKDGVIPPGYRAVERRDRSLSSGYEAWSGPKLLLAEPPVIESRNIVASEAQHSLTMGGGEWVTTLEMDAPGATAFDAAAKVLFSQKPSGMIAILLDGEVRSTPVVRSATFGGHAQVSGSKTEAEARDLAVMFRSGALPVGLGRMQGGVFVPGEPEDERVLGPVKK